MCQALASSRTREKKPCDRVLSLPCGFYMVAELPGAATAKTRAEETGKVFEEANRGQLEASELMTGGPLPMASVAVPFSQLFVSGGVQQTTPFFFIQSLSADSPGSHSLLNQGQWTYMADTRDLSATQPGLPFVVYQALCHQARQKDLGHRKMAQDAHLAAPWPWRATSLTRCCLRCWRKCRVYNCQINPFMCRSGDVHPCTPSPSGSIMSCEWGT